MKSEKIAPDGAERVSATDPAMAEGTIPLPGMKLSAGAKKVRAGLTDKEEPGLLKIEGMSYGAAMERLTKVPRPERDRDIVGLIMALQRGRASEGEFARAFETVRKYYTANTPAWLKAARDLCRALIEAEGKAKVASGLEKNVVGIHGYEEHVGYGLDKLKSASQLKPYLFRHGTEIARVAIVKEEDSARVSILSRDEFAALLPARYYAPQGEDKAINVPPPAPVVGALYHHPELPLPYLSGVTRFPTFGADGSMTTLPGYSAKSHSYYVPPVDLTIPAVGEWLQPGTRERDLAEAKRLLVEELLGDFPFCGWDRARIMAAYRGESGEPLPASMLNAIGLLIEPIVRSLIAGPTPAVLVSKPSPATGATHLVEAIQMIVSGTANAHPPLSRSEEERRKVLFTAIKAGEPVILFDNQRDALDSPTVASLLTSTVFTDRELGRSEWPAPIGWSGFSLSA